MKLHASFRPRHPALRVAPLALLIATALTSPTLLAAPMDVARDDADTPDASAGASTLDTVLVTGSRSSTRTVKNSSTPIDVVSAQDLVATGKASLLEALQFSLPSLTQNGGYQSDQESLIRGYRLRNLSPAYTLVLINGKRRNASAYAASTTTYAGHSWADLALIPVGAIDHVEVLRDGASAIYGSDAIAGVINVILKSQSEGGGVSIESGQSYAGDGSRTTARANLGLPWGERGFVNVSAENTNQQHAIRSAPYLDSVSTNGVQGNTIYSTPSYGLKSLVVNAGHEVGENHDFYATVTAADRIASAIQNYRLASTVASNNRDALSVWPDGFSPKIQTKEQQSGGTTGLKGTLGDWSYDASLTYNRDTIRTYTRDSLNYDLPYPGSPTDFYDGKIDYRQGIGNVDLRRAFDVAHLASPLDFSVGVEYQYEKYRRAAGQWASYYGQGAASFIGYGTADATSADRHGEAVYVGASANVTARWFLDLAGRYEDHSDFGGVSTGRLSSRFDFSDRFAMRATVSNGFHAPSLSAQYYQATKSTPTSSTLTAAVDSATARALGATALEPEKSTNYSVGFTFDPNPNFHVALDFYQIAVRNQLGASSYIGYGPGDRAGEYKDSSGTVLTSAQKATIDALLASAGVTIPDDEAYYVQYFTNVGDTRTRGVELTLEASQDTGAGRWRYTYAVNYGKTEVTRVTGIPAALQGLPNITLLSASTRYSLEHGSPEYTQTAGINWSQGPLSLNLNLQYYGPIRQLSNGYYYQIDPRLLTGIGGNYDFGHGWSLALGVDNVFNEKTSKVPYAAQSSSTRNTFLYTYDSADRVGTIGGYWYGRINYRF